MSFPTCMITVLNTLNHAELAKKYRSPKVHQGPCLFFEVGQEFFVEYLAERAEGFACDWAWDDMHKIIMVLMTDGNFGTWMVNKDQFIPCCTDGIKPLVVRVERIENDLTKSVLP